MADGYYTYQVLYEALDGRTVDAMCSLPMLPPVTPEDDLKPQIYVNDVLVLVTETIALPRATTELGRIRGRELPRDL